MGNSYQAFWLLFCNISHVIHDCYVSHLTPLQLIILIKQYMMKSENHKGFHYIGFSIILSLPSPQIQIFPSPACSQNTHKLNSYHRLRVQVLQLSDFSTFHLWIQYTHPFHTVVRRVSISIFQPNTGIISELRPHSLPSTSFPVHYSPTIPPSDICSPRLVSSNKHTQNIYLLHPPSQTFILNFL